MLYDWQQQLLCFPCCLAIASASMAMKYVKMHQRFNWMPGKTTASDRPYKWRLDWPSQLLAAMLDWQSQPADWNKYSPSYTCSCVVEFHVLCWYIRVSCVFCMKSLPCSRPCPQWMVDFWWLPYILYCALMLISIRMKIWRKRRAQAFYNGVRAIDVQLSQLK